MIARTLDKMLDIPQAIAIGIVRRKKNIKRPLMRPIQMLKNLILPIERYNKRLNFDPGYEQSRGWNEYSSDDWELKRKLAKVFENRRKAQVGESFPVKDIEKFWCGRNIKVYEAKRVNPNTVLYRGNVISSNRKELVKYAEKGFTPIHYKQVIF